MKRLVNRNYEDIDRDVIDLSKGEIVSAIAVRKGAEPVDNITKFGYLDEDYEEVDMFVEFTH